MPDVEFTFHKSAFEQFIAGRGGMIGKTLSDLADKVLTEQQRLAPVDTGALRDSLKKVATDDGGYKIGTDTIDYALHQEFGTYKMNAHPYLRPSLDAVKR